MVGWNGVGSMLARVQECVKFAIPCAFETALESRLESRKSLQGSKNEVGVSDGVRTRDFRSHSPALYH